MAKLKTILYLVISRNQDGVVIQSARMITVPRTYFLNGNTRRCLTSFCIQRFQIRAHYDCPKFYFYIKCGLVLAILILSHYIRIYNHRKTNII